MLILDLSNNNAEPDWKHLRAHGVDAVFLKASEGNSWVDPTFKSRRKAANAAGIRVGAYHFARPDLHVTPKQEAANFCKVVGKVGLSDLRPVLDFETYAHGVNLENWARDWNNRVKDVLKVGPLFYSYPAFIHEMNLSKPIGYGLWLASFSKNDGVEHPYSIPSPWKHAVLHQFTSNGHVFGVPGKVDENYPVTYLATRFEVGVNQFGKTEKWPFPILAHPVASYVLPDFFTKYGV